MHGTLRTDIIIFVDGELRNLESPCPGCPPRPGHGSRLVIIKYQDADEV